MTPSSANPQPDPAKLARLKEALDGFEGGQLFDRQHEDQLAPIRKRALGLLDQRARSRHELRERLINAEFAPQLVDEVLDSLEDATLVDDSAFATEWVRQRASARGKSARALEMELRDKGIAAEIRAEALAQISAEDESAQARAVAEKKARSVRDVPADRAEYDKVLRRVVGALARRGYGAELSMPIARDALDARIAEITPED